MNLDKNSADGNAVSDGEIIELYYARDERAIKETERKYGKYLFALAYRILADKPECEECIDDTYLKIWNSIPPARPRVLKAYLITVCRRCAVNRYHKNSRKSIVPSELTLSFDEIGDLVTENCVEKDLDAKRLGKVLSEFVRALPERKRFVFMSRYYETATISSIAKDIGASTSTVNKELSAIRLALKEKLESEGFNI